MSVKLQKYVGGSDALGYSQSLAPFSSRASFELDGWIDSLFNSFWENPSFLRDRNWRPTGIEEDKENYNINIEIPGFKKSEITISTQGNNIKVSAKNQKSQYVRTFAIGDWQIDKAKTKLENGVLSIQIPKSEKQKEKVIDIQEVKEQSS